MNIFRKKRLLSAAGFVGTLCVVGSWYVLDSTSGNGILVIALLLVAGVVWTIPVGLALWQERETFEQTATPRWLIVFSMILLLLSVLLLFPLAALNLLLILTP